MVYIKLVFSVSSRAERNYSRRRLFRPYYPTFSHVSFLFISTLEFN